MSEKTTERPNIEKIIDDVHDAFGKGDIVGMYQSILGLLTTATRLQYEVDRHKRLSIAIDQSPSSEQAPSNATQTLPEARAPHKGGLLEEAFSGLWKGTPSGTK